MTNILTILTGGTIGSTTSNGVVSASPENSSPARSLFSEQRYGGVRFKVVSPFTIHSENITPNHWTVLLNCLREHISPQHHGVIVTHGSDTLPHTSSLFAKLLGNSCVPVIFVASGKPVDQEPLFATLTIDHAVNVISSGAYSGVMCVYTNPNGKTHLFNPKLLPEADFFGAFPPPSRAVTPRKPRGPLCVPNAEFTREVLYVKPYVGLNYENIVPNERTAAVLLDSYHSSTVNVGDGCHSALAFAKKCAARGIDIWLRVRIPLGDYVYESVKTLLDIGVTPLEAETLPCALAELWVRYNVSRQT